MTRKASEVLLSLEQNVKQNGRYLQNVDMLLKQLLNRLGALERILSSPLPEQMQPQQPQQPQPQPPVQSQQSSQRQIPGLKTSVVMSPNGELNNVREPEEEYNFEPYQPEENLQVESQPQGKRRDVRYTSDPAQEKKVPVQQQVIYETDNKNVCLASVEIFDSNNRLVGSSKTNNTGKWTQMLIPGRYAVSISKKGTSTKPPVECSYFIDVPKSNTPVVKDPVMV